MIKARAKLPTQLWDVSEHQKQSGTLDKGAVVAVVRRSPRVGHVVVLHEGAVHAAPLHHLEMLS